MTAVEYPVIADEDMPRWEHWIEGITGITLEGRKHVLERCIYQRLLGCGVPSLEEYRRLVDFGATRLLIKQNAPLGASLFVTCRETRSCALPHFQSLHTANYQKPG